MNLKEGARYIKNTKTGSIYPHSEELEGHTDCVVFVHQAKAAPKRVPAPRPPAPAPAPVRELDIVQPPVDDGLPEFDPSMDELSGLTDLDDPEGDPQ